MSKEFERFNNGDLGFRYERYIENGKIDFEHIRVTQLEEDSFALDIYWGDELPYEEYDTYLYDTEKEAAMDGLLLHIISLERALELRYAWKLNSGGGVFYVNSDTGRIIKKESYGNELNALYPNVEMFFIGDFENWAEDNLSDDWYDTIMETREADVNLFRYMNRDGSIIDADEGFREEYAENSEKAFEKAKDCVTVE